LSFRHRTSACLGEAVGEDGTSDTGFSELPSLLASQPPSLLASQQREALHFPWQIGPADLHVELAAPDHHAVVFVGVDAHGDGKLDGAGELFELA